MEKRKENVMLIEFIQDKIIEDDNFAHKDSIIVYRDIKYKLRIGSSCKQTYLMRARLMHVTEKLYALASTIF